MSSGQPLPTERDLLHACFGLMGLIDAAEETLAAPGDPEGITRAELAQAKGGMCQELADTEQALVDLYGYPNPPGARFVTPQWMGDVRVPGE